MPEETPGKGLSPGKAPISGEVCVASEVFLRKVKFVYDKWSFTKGEVAVEKEYGFLVYSYSYHKLGDLSTTLEMTVLFLVVISTKWNAWKNPLMQSRTLLRVYTRVDINPLMDFRYTLKRSICAIALDMP